MSGQHQQRRFPKQTWRREKRECRQEFVTGLVLLGIISCGLFSPAVVIYLGLRFIEKPAWPTAIGVGLGLIVCVPYLFAIRNLATVAPHDALYDGTLVGRTYLTMACISNPIVLCLAPLLEAQAFQAKKEQKPG